MYSSSIFILKKKRREINMKTVLILIFAILSCSCGFLHNNNLECDFEDSSCNWKWNTTLPAGFRVISGEDAAEILRQNPGAYSGPLVDATNSSKGHFLYLSTIPGTKELHVWSPKLEQTQKECQLQLWLNMENMSRGIFKVVVDSRRSWVVADFPGNDRRTWEKYEIRIGRVQQEFRIILEITPSLSLPARVSMDSFKLVDCFPEFRILGSCVDNLFRCSVDSDDFCINKTQVCDIQQDCLNGADEKQGCDEVPKIGRCSFEDGWCGWSNSPSSTINWTMQSGVGYISQITGPAYDHTFQNQSGVYLYANMSASTTSLGASAILESTSINPPPRYHARPNSTYYKSCFIRFFYHQYYHSGSLGLFLIEMDPAGQKTIRLFYTFGDKGDTWHRKVVPIPTNITYNYYLQFEARRGLRARGDISLDDVSMSPECFGLNVPEKEKEGYDYDNFSGFVAPTKPVEVHADFVNKTVYLFTSCGARGRLGPTPENCSKAYNSTETKVSVLQDASLRGVQRWVVPEDKFYTIIAKGAGGGMGYDSRGSSKGASAIGIAELSKGQSLYILVGQEGISGCRKNFAVTQHYSCGQIRPASSARNKPYNPIKELKNIDLMDGGGGGGGASFVYLWTRKQGRIPLVIGAGGGGLGGGNAIDDEQQNGKGMDVNRQGVTGSEYGNNSAGAGGGWNESNGTWREITGGSLMQGAIGGKACGINFDNHGMGGFGGGGGGCATGGGGGGFAGGSASAERRNGHGGYSYVAHNLAARHVIEGDNLGRGSVIIIPAVQGCGCNYLCAALDEYRQSVKCICPNGWMLGNDDVSCHLQEKGHLIISEKLLTVLLVLLMVVFVSCICYYFYKCTRKKKKDRLHLKTMNESELQLNRLRLASDSMMTEYNPNYEFGGGTYTIRDLNEVPRENLRLVKALGQGAFGEVYQGFYRYRTGDIIEMPVAVKTLPELSTSQAETDFLMEALIMSKFTHPNIVHFIGVCFDKHPRFIVLELLAGGDLKNFLRESRPKPERPSPLVMKDLLMCAIDVAKGCAYLEEHRFIHRDIAARNCLLTTKGPGRTVKIADFGMARDIYRADYYRKGGKAMLPIKWMPPEAFQDGIFTAKTDIWSFGILLWEVMSLGYMPYTGCGNREVMQLVISGGRLEPPVNCPSPVYAIMTKCWHPKPDERPSFKLILERLGYCLQDPEVLNAPLPVFNRLPSSERDSTIMRPETNSSECLQTEGTSDYLEPNRGNPNPYGKNPTDSWETSFAVPESQSTQPLLQAEGIGGTAKTPQSAFVPSGRDRRSLTSALSLDAGALVKQPSIPYMNVKIPQNLGNEVGDGESPFTISRHLRNEAEISC